MRHVLLAAVLAAGPVWNPPVDGPVRRPFAEPSHQYGAGHRGVDFAVAPGTTVRAAAPGTVVFAGRVGEGRHVVIDHGAGLRTSYSFLADIAVARGDRLSAGDRVGQSGGRGPRHSPGEFHFGVRRHGRYVDPAAFLPLTQPQIRLAPVGGRPTRTCAPVTAVH